MSSAPDLLDAERENYLRLAQLLVEGGTSALRKQFEDRLRTLYPGATLGGVLKAKEGQLQQLQKKGKLNKTQLKMLYPAIGDPDMNNFDITLLSVLLRNIGSSRSPTDQFWNNPPPHTDNSKEANCVRLRLLRNEMGHSPNITIKDDEFETYWMRISNVLISLGGNKDEIDDLKTKPLATRDFVGVLQQWRAADDEILQELHELRKEMKQRDEEAKQRDEERKQRDEEIMKGINKTCPLNVHIDLNTVRPSPPSSPSLQDFYEKVMHTTVENFIRQLNLLPTYYRKNAVDLFATRYNAEYVTSEETNSLSITISCQSLEGLQKLWDDAQTGRLNEEMEKLLVVDEVLQLYNLKEIKLQTKIDPEDFVNCWNQMKSDPDTPSADEHDQEVEQELMRRIREAEDAAQREKEKRKVIEAALAQMIQENTSKFVDKLKKKELTESEREELLQLLVAHHKVLLENVSCFEDSLRDKELGFLKNIVHDLNNSVMNVKEGKEELAKLIPKYHEIMIRNIEQDPKSEKSYQALRDTTHDLLDALRDILQAQTEHTKLIPKYHEIMIKNIEQDPKSEKSYQALRDTTHDLLDALRDIYQAQTEHAKLIPKYHEIMIKNIEQDPKSEKSYQALRDTTHDLARFCKGKEELDEIFLKYHTFLLKNIEQEPMSERSHNALIAATHDLSEFSSCVTDEGKQQLSKLLPQYYTILLRKIEQDPMSKSSLDALITATDDLSKMWHSSEIGKQEITKLIPKHNENILKITERVMNESGSADSGLDRLERVISILTSLVKPTSQDNRKILDLIVKMADEISQDTESVKGLDRIQKTVEDLGRFLQPSDAGQKQLFKLTDELCNTLIHRVKLSDDLEPLIRRVEALSKNLSGPSSDRVVISLLSVIEAALRLTKEDPHPHLFDSLERLCCIVIDKMKVTHLDGEELSRILTSLYKCFAALAESPRYSIKVQWMMDKQMMALEEMIERHPKSGKEVTKTIPFSSSDIGGLGLGSEKGKWQVVQEQKKKDTSEFPESHLETRKDTELK